MQSSLLSIPSSTFNIFTVHGTRFVSQHRIASVDSTPWLSNRQLACIKHVLMIHVIFGRLEKITFVRLTAFTDYALRVLMQVALREGELVQVSEIAGSFGISRNHLTKVVNHLSAGDFLITQQGRNGGMRLARPADTITVGQVVRDFEPDFRLVECLEPETGDCRIQSVCVLKDVFGDALEQFLGRLDAVSIADLLRPRIQLQSLLKFPVISDTSRA